MRVNIISKVFFFSLLLILFSTSVLANEVTSFSTEVRAINRTVMLGETAYFEVDITNNHFSSQSFRIRSPDFRWELLSQQQQERIRSTGCSIRRILPLLQ